MEKVSAQKSYIETVKEDAEEMICLLKQSSKEDKRVLIGYIRGYFDGKESVNRERTVKEG